VGPSCCCVVVGSCCALFTCLPCTESMLCTIVNAHDAWYFESARHCNTLQVICTRQVLTPTAQAVDGAKASCMINLAMASQRQEKYSDVLTRTEKALRCCGSA
jgi:hypothetical protein